MTDENGLTRRRFLKAGWYGLGALAVGEGVYVGYRFLSPRIGEGQFGGIFDAGRVDEYPPGSVTLFTEGRFYLVRQIDGGFLALYRQCTHLGCAVPWDAEQQKFVCPCHGSNFEQDGAVLNPPAPRPLDLFAVTIENGTDIRVDTGQKTQRDNTDGTFAIYPEEIP